MTYRIDGLSCPACQEPIEEQTELARPGESVVPRVGDYSICAHCFKFLAYVEDGDRLALREASEDEESEILAVYPEAKAVMVMLVFGVTFQVGSQELEVAWQLFKTAGRSMP